MQHNQRYVPGREIYREGESKRYSTYKRMCTRLRQDFSGHYIISYALHMEHAQVYALARERQKERQREREKETNNQKVMQ